MCSARTGVIKCRSPRNVLSLLSGDNVISFLPLYFLFNYYFWTSQLSFALRTKFLTHLFQWKSFPYVVCLLGFFLIFFPFLVNSGIGYLTNSLALCFIMIPLYWLIILFFFLFFLFQVENSNSDSSNQSLFEHSRIE